jgi:hypothetical protein
MEEIDEMNRDFEKESENSVSDITRILDQVGYDFSELESIPDPNILVLGVQHYYPEAQIIKKIAEEEKNNVFYVDCVDSSQNAYLYDLLHLDNTDHFKMQFHLTDFKKFPFDRKYDLILLLRYSSFSIIPDSVYERIVDSLNKGGVFIMSGGFSASTFSGYSLASSKLTTERKENVKRSPTDYFQIYGGENIVVKFRKVK